jgi:hypothetical protein
VRNWKTRPGVATVRILHSNDYDDDDDDNDDDYEQKPIKGAGSLDKTGQVQPRARPPS